jgi:hypothetical protein
MPSRTDFWLYMHRLAAALDAEGVTPQERAENIVASFRQMPPVVRQEVLTDLRQLVRSLDEIEIRVIATANELSQAEVRASPGQRPGNVA